MSSNEGHLKLNGQVASFCRGVAVSDDARLTELELGPTQPQLDNVYCCVLYVLLKKKRKKKGLFWPKKTAGAELKNKKGLFWTKIVKKN